MKGRDVLAAFAREAVPEQERETYDVDVAAREARAAQGRAAQASGKAFEAWLDGQHTAARVAGLADVEHLHPRTVMKGGTLTYAERSGPDYRGVLRGGRALAVEAKNAGRHTLPLVPAPQHRTGLRAHQRAALARCHALGGLSLVVVRFTRAAGDVVYAVPWDAIAGLDVLSPDDARGFEVPAQAIYLAKWVT